MKTILSIIALFFGCMVSTALAIDAGTVSGTLKVGKEQVKLKYCYAHQYNNEEGMREAPELRILMTDRPVQQSLLAGYDAPIKIDRLARQEKIRGVLLKLDPKKPATGMSGTILLKPKDPKASLIFFTSSGNNELKDMKVGDNRVGGKVDYKSDGQGFFKDIPSFELSASFSAPLFHDEPITARLVGPKAVKSAPAQALISYYTALAKGDFDAARNNATDESWNEFEERKAQIGEKEFKKMLTEMTNPSELAQQINKVFIRGSHAVVILQEAGGKSAQSMIQINGEWKVD